MLRSLSRGLLLVVVAAASVALGQTPPSSNTTSSAAAQSEGSEPVRFYPAKAAPRLKPVPAPYPKPVQRALEAGRRECFEEGGTAIVLSPGIVRAGDLTGDGRDDYVLDFRESRCLGRVNVFNGTAGWDLEIFVARAKGDPARVFSGRVRDYDLAGKDGRVIVFDLHGGYCGLAGVEACVRRHRISARPFAFRQR